MIKYDNHAWFKLVFMFNKSDTLRMLFPAMCILALFTGLIVYLDLHWFKIELHFATVLHSMIGFVISLLLVFRTNTAYERWWEGRKLWGALVNNTRNMAIYAHTWVGKDDTETRERFKLLLGSFPEVLKHHLRDGKSTSGVAPEHVHQPNYVASLIHQEFTTLYKLGKITGDQLKSVKEEMQSLTDICGACERIKNTPIPYSYSMFLKKFLSVYIFSISVGYAHTLHYSVIPLVVFIFYVLMSLELIAEEIEEPFGKDTNDLPLGGLAERMRKNVVEILTEFPK